MGTPVSKCSRRPRVHNHVDTREELREYDPALFTLIDEVFHGTAWRYVRYDKRQESLKPVAKESIGRGAPHPPNLAD